jgi:hypothetical protein
LTNVANDLTVVITTIPTRKIRLRKALRSVKQQTLQPYEIIISEDTEKKGAPANRDAGLEAVTTTYVAFLDDDDYFYPDHLETLYNAIKEQDADIVYSWFDVEGGTDPFPENFGRAFDPENPCQTTVTTLCKTETVRNAGGFSNTYGLNEEQLATFAQGNTVGEDFRMVMSALQNGAKIYHVPKKTWAYVHWHGNTSGRPDRWGEGTDLFSEPLPTKLLIVVPSRQRPDNAHRLLDAIEDTASSPVDVLFAVDEDDPTLDEYPAEYTRVVQGGSMVAALNEVATVEAENYPYIGFLGDDTLPHKFWYGKIIYALESRKYSIVYPNDLIQGENLPTSVFMSSEVIKALGFMAPPTLNHLFVDNYWKTLGTSSQNLIYVDDAIIEHLHPLVGKAEQDAVYDKVNAVWGADETAFHKHLAENFLEEVRRISE